MKSFLIPFLVLLVFSAVDGHLRKKKSSSLTMTEAETAYHLKKLHRAISEIKQQLKEDCKKPANASQNDNTTYNHGQQNNTQNNNSNNSSQPSSNPNNNSTNTNTNTNTNSSSSSNSSSNTLSSPNNTNSTNSSNNNNNDLPPCKANTTQSSSSNSSCKCKHKITAAHLYAINDIIKKNNGDQSDTALFFSSSMKKDAFAKSKLTKYYVRKLLEKLQIGAGVIEKCMKAPLSAFAKVMKLSHSIVIGAAGYGELVTMSKLLCEELKVIPEKLTDSSIYNEVRNYMNNHIENKN